MWLGFGLVTGTEAVTSKKSKKEGVAGFASFARLVDYRQPHFSLHPMADLNPAPLFSPTEPKTDISDTGNVVIFHGEISSQMVSGPEITFAHIRVRVGPDPGTTNATSPPLPDNEPGQPVRPQLLRLQLTLIITSKPQDTEPDAASRSSPEPLNPDTAGNKPAQVVRP